MGTTKEVTESPMGTQSITTETKGESGNEYLNKAAIGECSEEDILERS